MSHKVYQESSEVPMNNKQPKQQSSGRLWTTTDHAVPKEAVFFKNGVADANPLGLRGSGYKIKKKAS
jgi:hypothetical protein